jgi:hypothetical protein
MADSREELSWVTRRPPRRQFRDADGRSWRVYEVSSGAGLSKSLIFEAEGIARRVRTYPPDWATLDEVALRALCETC